MPARLPSLEWRAFDEGVPERPIEPFNGIRIHPGNSVQITGVDMGTSESTSIFLVQWGGAHLETPQQRHRRAGIIARDRLRIRRLEQRVGQAFIDDMVTAAESLGVGFPSRSPADE